MDKVRPLKIENLTQGSQDDNGYPTELNPAEDYVSCKGISFEDSDTHAIDKDPITGEVRFLDEYSGQVLLSDLQSRNKFEYTEDGDIVVRDTTFSIFENDANNDMMPSLIGDKDRCFEIVDNDITPKI